MRLQRFDKNALVYDPYPSLLPGKVKYKGVIVTVCVAAMCAGNILLGASDRMLTAGDVEFEPESPKIYNPTNSIVVMVAGESSLQMEIMYRVYRWAAEQIKEKPQDWVPVGALAREYHRTYQSIKSEYAEARVLGPLALTLDSFIKRQKEMADSIVKDMTSAIVNFEMPGIEAIITGIDTTGAHIYVVTNSEIACRDAIGFAAIGVGYWHANSQFMFAGHNRVRPLPETLLLTYAAKKRAEVAPGVGVGTDMFTMGPELGSYSTILPGVIEDVDKIYKGTRKRSEASVKKANAEVNKYVEQLSKAAAAQEQRTTSPKPTTDKANGKEAPGETNSGAGKPN